jgi:hypothetical protein
METQDDKFRTWWSNEDFQKLEHGKKYFLYKFFPQIVKENKGFQNQSLEFGYEKNNLKIL